MKSRSFPAVARADARILILGSLPGQISLTEQQYYAHPRNGFWPIMGTLFGASPELSYEKRLEKLKTNRIALWDVCAAAVRPGSLDSAITEEEPNDFAAFLRTHPHIALIAFNGQPAARLFAKHVLRELAASAQSIPRTVLPSTSPAHAGMPLARKLSLWQAALAAQHA